MASSCQLNKEHLNNRFVLNLNKLAIFNMHNETMQSTPKLNMHMATLHSNKLPFSLTKTCPSKNPANSKTSSAQLKFIYAREYF